MRRVVSYVEAKYLTYSAAIEALSDELDKASDIVSEREGLDLKLWYDNMFEVWRYYIVVYGATE